jgi:predicted nucleic acid-binding Zn ribbon protein
MNRHAPRPLSFALEGFTDSLAPSSTLALAQRVWQQVAGSAIAEAGRPTAERDGMLTITCSDAVWAAELDLMSPELVTRLNQALGKELIHKLRCRIG